MRFAFSYVLLFGVVLALGSGCGPSSCPITYEVTGSGNKLSVVYTDSSGGVVKEEITASKWTKKIDFDIGAPVNAGGVCTGADDAACTVTAKISSGSTVIDTKSGSGAPASATAMGKAECN